MRKLPKFIESLDNKDIKGFLEKFNFDDYDFSRENNRLEVRIEENKKVYDYFLTDYSADGKNPQIANALAKKFSQFLEEQFGEVYHIAKKEYFSRQNGSQKGE